MKKSLMLLVAGAGLFLATNSFANSAAALKPGSAFSFISPSSINTLTIGKGERKDRREKRMARKHAIEKRTEARRDHASKISSPKK